MQCNVGSFISSTPQEDSSFFLLLLLLLIIIIINFVIIVRFFIFFFLLLLPLLLLVLLLLVVLLLVPRLGFALRCPYFFLQRTGEVCHRLARNRGGNSGPPRFRRALGALGPGTLAPLY